MKSYFFLYKKGLYTLLALLFFSTLWLFPSKGYGEAQGTQEPQATQKPQAIQEPNGVQHPNAPDTSSVPKEKNTPVEQIGPDEYKIGNLLLNKKTKEISIPGQVNMQSGLVEYLACRSVEAAKLHESVLKLDVKPSDVQVALLLMGAKPDNNLKCQGDTTLPKGDPLEIWVEWELPDKTKKRVRGEEVLYNQIEKKTMGKTIWAFTGSFIREGRFTADEEGSIIATFRDPVAIINNPLPVGADDTQLFCHEKLLPPVGTKIIMIIKASTEPPLEKVTPDKLENKQDRI